MYKLLVLAAVLSVAVASGIGGYGAGIGLAGHGAGIGLAGHGVGIGLAGHGAGIGLAGHGVGIGLAGYAAGPAIVAAPAAKYALPPARSVAHAPIVKTHLEPVEQHGYVVKY